MRNYEKLVEDYKKKYYGKPLKYHSGQVGASDFDGIKELARKIAENEKADSYLYYCIETALMGGIMIGYNARKNEEKQKAKEKSTVSIY